ncbi:MAG: hypothetical protein KAW41_06540 [Candidatus Diapherotrites archaeon]|nr:hypothetical protein [Candidatus Diapherotrites archaeon]
MLTKEGYNKVLKLASAKDQRNRGTADGTWFARHWPLMEFIGKEIIPKINAKKVIVHDIGPGTKAGPGGAPNSLGHWYGKPEACSEPYEIVNQLEKNKRDYEINIINQHWYTEDLYKKDYPTLTFAMTELVKQFYGLSKEVANYHEEFLKHRRKKVRNEAFNRDEYRINVRPIQRKFRVMMQNHLLVLPRKRAHLTFALRILNNLDRKPRTPIQQAFLFHQVRATLKNGFVVTDYQFRSDKEVKSFGLKRMEEKGPGKFVYRKIKEPKFRKP